jgi:hypothetical protein
MVAGNGDFVIFYTGAQMLIEGRGSELYHLEVQKVFQDKFKVPIRDGPLPYNHPPYELLLFLPLIYLPFPTAHLVWSLVSAALLVLTFVLLTPFIDNKNQWLFATIMIAFYPTIATIMYGQDSILTAFLFAGVFAALKQKRHIAAGSILALGLYKPQLVLPMACFLFYKRCWRACTSFTLTAAVLAGVSIGLVGWKGVSDFGTLLQLIDLLNYTIDPANMANVRGLLDNVFAFSRSFGLTHLILLSSVLVLGSSLYICTADFDASDPLFDLEFSLVVIATLLSSYHLYAHDLTLLVIPTILIFNHILAGRVEHSCLSRVFPSIVLTLWFPLVFLVLIQHRLLYFTSILIMLFAIVLAKEICHTRSRAHVPVWANS